MNDAAWGLNVAAWGLSLRGGVVPATGFDTGCDACAAAVAAAGAWTFFSSADASCFGGSTAGTGGLGASVAVVDVAAGVAAAAVA